MGAVTHPPQKLSSSSPPQLPMYTRLLPALIRSLLTLLFFLDLINASPTRPDLVHNNNNPQPSLLPPSAFSPRAVPPPAAPYLLPRAPTPLTPQQQQQHNHSNNNNHRHEGYIKPLAEAAAGYNLKFKEYSKWIKESSKSIWNKHATTTTTAITKARTSSLKNNNDKEHYVSPYLTQFADKHDSWWSVGLNFGVMWRHVLWEVVPEWFRGSEPQR